MTESVIFMKAAGVTGESMNAAYKQWTDCRSVSFDLQNSRRHGSQGPSNSTAGDVVCMALVDNACTALTQKCASGANIPKVEFAFVKMGEQQVEYMRYTI